MIEGLEKYSFVPGRRCFGAIVFGDYCTGEFQDIEHCWGNINLTGDGAGYSLQAAC
jgi:hypothetical protein